MEPGCLVLPSPPTPPALFIQLPDHHTAQQGAMEGGQYVVLCESHVSSIENCAVPYYKSILLKLQQIVAILSVSFLTFRLSAITQL